MALYILKRLLLMIPTLIGVMLITFAVTQFVPGGPVERMVAQMRGFGAGGETGSVSSLYQGNKGLDQQRIAQLKKLYGFDKPPVQRFVDMMRHYFVFDFGQSYYHHMSVAQLVISKLPVSMSLGLWTFLIVYSVCIPLGIAKAVRDGSPFDVFTSSVILVGYAIPGFALGIALIVLFGGGSSFWSIFPLRGLVSDNWHQLGFWAKITDYLWHMVLPVTASTVGSLAVMTLLTKNSFLEEIRKQYVITAHAKGLSEHQVLYKHVFRNAIIPIITGFPGSFITAFFTGSLLIETIFSLDGMGLLAYESVMNRDYPVVLGTLYFFTLIGLISRLLSDISYVLVDPRISFEGRK